MTAFFRITLPQIASGFAAGAIFAFIVSFDNVSVSVFLTGAQFTTLPVELLAYSVNDSNPLAASVSVLMIVASLVAVLLLERLMGLRKVIA